MKRFPRRRSASRGTVTLAVVLATLGCARGATVATSPGSASPVAAAPACTFANPLVPGADPWVVRRDSVYYYVKTHDRRIWVSRATRLSDVFTAPARAVWSGPETGWTRDHSWSPEMRCSA